MFSQEKIHLWRNGSHIRQQQSSAAVSITVKLLKGYPNLPCDESDTELGMTETGASEMNPMEEIVRKMQQMERQTELLKQELQNVQQKEENRVFAKTWETNLEPRTHEPIARVVAMRERPKKQDGVLGYIEMLRTEISAGRAVLLTHSELSNSGLDCNGRFLSIELYRAYNSPFCIRGAVMGFLNLP